MNKKMQEVQDCDVPVVSEDFLDKVTKGGALIQIPSFTISDWGAPRHSLPQDDTDFYESEKSFKSKGQFETLITTCIVYTKIQ